MPVFESESIQQVALHRVGNQATQEGIVLSECLLQLSDQLQDLLINYFITPFKVEEYYHFYHDDNLELNDLYRHASHIFEDPECLLEESRAIAKLLYDKCNHPSIKGGDLFVVYFSSALVNGITTSAIGLFKSENKDSFLKVVHGDENWSRESGNDSATTTYHLEVHQGINIKKLDKGALIFNTEAENGYLVSVVDATNRTTDAAYWKDAFLQIRQRHDDFFKTNEVMRATKQFVTQTMPDVFEMTKADEAEFLNKSMEYFKNNDSFEMEDFARDVLGQPDIIDSFTEFKQTYEKENEVEIPEQFDINETAVKKQSRAYKSVIKLDKNFHIYVHGDRQLIEQDEDEKGKYYKIYYKEES